MMLNLVCQEKEGSVLALIKMRSSEGEWVWMHTVFAVRGNLCHEVQEGRRVRHVIHCYYQTLRCELPETYCQTLRCGLL